MRHTFLRFIKSFLYIIPFFLIASVGFSGEKEDRENRLRVARERYTYSSHSLKLAASRVKVLKTSSIGSGLEALDVEIRTAVSRILEEDLKVQTDGFEEACSGLSDCYATQALFTVGVWELEKAILHPRLQWTRQLFQDYWERYSSSFTLPDLDRVLHKVRYLAAQEDCINLLVETGMFSSRDQALYYLMQTVRLNPPSKKRVRVEIAPLVPQDSPGSGSFPFSKS